MEEITTKNDITIIKINKFNIEVLDKIELYDGLSIKYECDNSKIFIDINDNEVSLDYYLNDYDHIIDLYNYFTKKHYDLNNIKIYISNDKYYNYDFSKLNELSNKTNIYIYLNSIDRMTFDDFETLYQSINWYRKIINDYDLSPVEKLTFAYDILKTFEYKDTEDKYDPRVPYRILKTGNIVCAGYTNLLKEIFKEFDSNIKVSSFIIDCYNDKNELKGRHSRSIVNIDDDKYNIHGMYILDPTFDSNNNEVTHINNQKLGSFDLYEYYLMTYDEYNKEFPYDSKIKILFHDYKDTNNNINESNLRELLKEKNKSLYSILGSELRPLFINKDDEYIIDRLFSKTISFKDKLKIIRNTRLSEGFNKDDLDEEMNRISIVNDKSL